MSDLKIGDSAPLFTATDQTGQEINLSQYKGRKVVLYFYPKDNTPGCTAEACSLRDGKKELEGMGFEIIGVSPDSEKSHQNFTQKHQLNFTLISDPDKTIARHTERGDSKSLWVANIWALSARHSSSTRAAWLKKYSPKLTRNAISNK